jgi:protein gp37
MSTKTTLEWTESTWNPVTGRSKISPGCKNCYAERMAKRLQAMKRPNYRNGFKVTTQPHAVEIPLKWKKSQMIFVNSMSDLFHKEVPEDFIFQLFDVMNKADWHLYQILTKRVERMLDMSSDIKWADRIWMGVTVENADYLYRIDSLRKTNAQVKFISFEPLLGSIGDVNLEDIDWVIVGGESGPGARPMEKMWVLELRDQCLKAKVPFFFKQWGGVRKKTAGRVLEGKIYSETPLEFKKVA